MARRKKPDLKMVKGGKMTEEEILGKIAEMRELISAGVDVQIWGRKTVKGIKDAFSACTAYMEDYPSMSEVSEINCEVIDQLHEFGEIVRNIPDEWFFEPDDAADPETADPFAGIIWKDVTVMMGLSVHDVIAQLILVKDVGAWIDQVFGARQMALKGAGPVE